MTPHEDVEYKEPEPNEKYPSGSDEEECGEENDSDDASSAQDNKDGVHSSGYNLRKRKTINYGETRNYKTTATVLYQHEKVLAIAPFTFLIFFLNLKQLRIRVKA